ncbi:MAG: hypothetical protein FJ104_05445, partial [Deltaproteobacteria bacterium]|nr:hypothetical protein [Deltaproteobacteria bacterium]
VFGVHAIIPGQDFTTVRSNYPDEREQFFSNSLHPELYSDSLTATSLAFGVGSRPLRWISFGVSFTLSLTNSAAARTYVRDPVDYQKLQLDNEIRVTTGVAPHFGVVIDPNPRLRLSATLHTEQKLAIRTGISATLPSGSESSVELTETHHFVPWTAAVGGEVVALRTDEERLALSWGFALAAWSTYVGAHGERPGGGAVDLGFRDILRTTAGVRYDRGGLRTHADLQHHPSPVPPQIGRTNYVDNDRVGLAIGASHAVTVLGFSLRPGLTVVGHQLLRRHQLKRDELLRDEVPDGAVDRDLRPLPGTRGLQTNNPGWPGFASEGYLLGATAWIGAEY